MTSTRKSKKGFQKLDSHELAEFPSLGNGTLSGSENDLLDLTTVEEGEPRGRWSGCCCWCSCLYFGLLTILFLLLGVYCGYLTFNLWQMADTTTNTHNDLDSRLASMEAGMKNYKTEMAHKYSALQQSIRTLEECLNKTQNSVRSFQESTENSLKELGSKVENIDERLKVAESNPQETLIKQVDVINKDMAVLNRNMRKLNTSLSDINSVKSQIAELGSINDRYEDDLRQIKTGIAEVRQDNSEMKESVDAAVETAAKYKTRLDKVDSTLASTHDQMKQTTDLLSAQVTSVQQSLTAINETVKPYMDGLWSSIDTMNSSMEMLSDGLSSLREQVVQILNQTPAETLDHTPKASPPTFPPSPPTDSSKELEETVNKESTTSTEPSGEPTTPPTQSTESQSTSATEDSVPINGDEKNLKATAAVNNEEQPQNLNITEQDIETSKLVLERQINQTEGAVILLQSLADSFVTLDNNNDGVLILEEFLAKIPKRYIFGLLDTNQNSALTYEEVLWSIDSLKLKINQIERELKELQSMENGLEDNSEEEPTTENPDEESKYDPVLQQKLKELFEYMLHPN